MCYLALNQARIDATAFGFFAPEIRGRRVTFDDASGMKADRKK